MSSFTIRGIDVREKLDPADQTAFVTGLKFIDRHGGRDQDDPGLAHTGLLTWFWLLVAALLLIGLAAGLRHRVTELPEMPRNRRRT